MGEKSFKRREVLKGVALTGAMAGLSGCSLLGRKYDIDTGTGGGRTVEGIRVGKFADPDKKLRIACIGVGGMGHGDVMGFKGENIVALCDVDDKKAENSYKEFPDTPRFKDYRKMLQEMDGEIDAVTVSTPDHTHFPAAMFAIEMGKHVYVQKPLAHTIYEARELMYAARRHKVQTQMGIQGHAKEGPRLVQEWLAVDAIGPVTEVHYWTNRPIWPQGIERPTEVQDVPETLDWNLWLGTASWRPYNKAYCPFKWRGWWDFGCGALGDIGCHSMDAAYWTLDLGSPEWVEAEVSGHHKETAPEWSIITYQFPARGKKPPVKVVWHDGEKPPPRPEFLEEGRSLPDKIGGQLIIGEEGAIMGDCYCSSPRIIPEKKMKEFLKRRPPKTIKRIPKANHRLEWVKACKGGDKAGANFDYSARLTEMVLLGNLAVRTGKRIEWDTKKMLVTNVPEANQYLKANRREF